MAGDKSARTKSVMTRRQALQSLGAVTVAVAATPLVHGSGLEFALSAEPFPLAAIAGIDRVVMLRGKTYLNGWAGYGEPPRRGRGGRGAAAAAPPAPSGPAPSTTWSKLSGPGAVTFAEPKSSVTTATFSEPGEYVLQV